MSPAVTDVLHLSAIRIYPVKALDGVAVPSARLLPSGSLEHDREFAILDGEGLPVNGKRCPAVHRLRARLDFAAGRVSFRTAGGAGWKRFDLEDAAGIEGWLAPHFGFPVSWHRDGDGLPDDRRAHGPTVVSDATLSAVAGWFPPLTAGELARRFRPNLLLGGCPPFWEDRLYGPEGTVVAFSVGEAVFHGANPCRRCVVPSRDPESGEALPGFQETFSRRRRETLPPWAEPTRFADTAYRLCVNTSVPASEAGRQLRVGDAVTVLDGTGAYNAS